jgi:hypothetical protein
VPGWEKVVASQGFLALFRIFKIPPVALSKIMQNVLTFFTQCCVDLCVSAWAGNVATIPKITYKGNFVNLKKVPES